MMNGMGQGVGATVVGGMRIADWALAITYILVGLLFVIGFVAVVRAFLALSRKDRDERSSGDPAAPSNSGEGART